MKQQRAAAQHSLLTIAEGIAAVKKGKISNQNCKHAATATVVTWVGAVRLF